MAPRQIAILFIVCGVAFAGDEPVYTIHGPTVLGFFAPVKHPATEPDRVGQLRQFQMYAKQTHAPMEKAGIDFEEVYAETFQVRVGDKTESFDSGHMKVGYYFIAPGKKPSIEYGIAPPAALMQIAHEYFGVPANK